MRNGLLWTVLIAGCAPVVVEPPPPHVVEPVPIPAEPQLQGGDADAGFHFLVNGNYIGCGIPQPLYQAIIGDAAPALRLPGRNAQNESAPFSFNVFTTVRGNDVAHPNCLSCHATFLRGELLVGLGAYDADFTTDPTAGVGQARVLLSDAGDLVEFDLWFERAQTVAPFILERVVGVNPADALAPALASHRDAATLAWQDEPVFELEPTDALPVDVPPWWRVKHKNALYATGSGRGDHVRLLMQASTMCIDTVAEAERVAAAFVDVRAWMQTLEPPPWPYDVDANLVDEGRGVFEANCVRCHGLVGASYPNLFVPLELVGTDGALASASEVGGGYAEWFRESFYGQSARLVPGNGYVAPPLDGIWATAPFLHNASVPTLAALLNSSTRPLRWRRVATRGDDGYDEDTVGWHHDVIDAETSDVNVYDASRFGYDNAGHNFGDALTDSDRRALLELLKTF